MAGRPIVFNAEPYSKGDPGKSAYQVAVDNGFSGTEEEWLASLDGFSPIATVTKSGSVTTITITDKNGTTTAAIGAVDSVNGQTGEVVLDADDVGAYSKPSSGIPKTDLASAVQTSLGKADSALQSYTETDPVFAASAAHGISASDISAWNGKANVATINNTGDLDNVVDPGLYYIMSGASNKPTLFDSSPFGVLLVGKNTSGTYIVQTFFAGRSSYEGVAIRAYHSNQWHSWIRIGDAHTDSNLSWVENGTTASRAYSVGDFVTINGVLCKITASVSNGGTLTSGTNYSTVTGGLASEFVTALGDVETLLANI